MAVPAINDSYTPTQKRLLEVLSDGQRHKRDELLKCLGDPSTNNLSQAIFKLKQRLPRGTTITTEFINFKFEYRWVRLINTDE